MRCSDPKPESQGASKLRAWSPSPSPSPPSHPGQQLISRMRKDGFTACVSVTRAVGARASFKLSAKFTVHEFICSTATAVFILTNFVFFQGSICSTHRGMPLKVLLLTLNVIVVGRLAGGTLQKRESFAFFQCTLVKHQKLMCSV